MKSDQDASDKAETKLSMTHARRVGRPQNQAMDQALIEATLDLLAEGGYNALSLAEVARRANGSIPAIYRRHADKRQLALAALRSELAKFPKEVYETANLRDDLLGLVRQISTSITARRARIFAGVVLAGNESPELLALLAKELKFISSSIWRRAIDRAVARGERLTQGADADLVSSIPGAYILGSTLLEGAPPDMRRLEMLIDTVLLPAIKAPVSPPEQQR